MTPPAPAAAPRVVVVGSINTDLVAAVERLPGPGETVGGGTLVRQPGGKGANQAAALARLLGTSALVGSVGEDADAASVLAALRAAGVDTTGVRQVPGLATGTALITVDARGENQIVVCPGANSRVEVPADALAGADAVLAQLEVDQDVVLDAARRTGAFFALNASPAQPLSPELVARCDLVVVNEGERAVLPELDGARLVAVTRGAEGSELVAGGRTTARVTARAARVVNSVGAGDAWCAALVVALLRGLDHERALQVASAVAADAVSQESSQPDLAPFEDYLAPVDR